MDTPKNEVIAALDSIVEWSREREFPPREWAAPLQAALSGKDAMAQGIKLLPIPIAVFDRTGKIVLANDAMLEGLGMNDEHINNRKADVFAVDNFEFRNAVKLALQGDTSIVGGIKLPFTCMGTGRAYDNPKIKSAILFPVAEDRGTALRGAVMFLPFEYAHVDERIQTEHTDLRYGE